MPTETALSAPQSSAITTAQNDNSIAQVIQQALANGYSADHMRELYAFHREIKADQARDAFNKAFTDFKAEDIRIVRDKENTQYSKGEKKAMYTSLENMVATVTPYLSKHGLSASWGILAQTATSVTVSCTLTHVLGHSRTESITGPMDQSGAKNSLQQIKSSMTYLKVATFESVCGLASAFGNLSDDGNGAGPQKPRMAEEEVGSRIDSIHSCQTVEEVERVYDAAMKAAEVVEDREAAKGFLAAKKRRLREMREATQ